MRLILFAILLIMSLAGIAGAQDWQSLAFDGTSFVAGAGNAALLMRNGFLPAAGALAREDQLPKKTGAVAILCYLQQSGGRRRAGAAVVPMAGVMVTVARGALTVAGRTDASGYLILALPPGSYQVTVLGQTKRVVVKSDKSVPVAFRTGKRMVD